MPKLDPQLHTFTGESGPDDRPGDYYVSCVDAGRFVLLAGPFRNDHRAALEMVPSARKLACELDPKAVFYGFGTCRREPDPAGPAPPGILNRELGLPAPSSPEGLVSDQPLQDGLHQTPNDHGSHVQKKGD